MSAYKPHWDNMSLDEIAHDEMPHRDDASDGVSEGASAEPFEVTMRDVTYSYQLTKSSLPDSLYTQQLAAHIAKNMDSLLMRVLGAYDDTYRGPEMHRSVKDLRKAAQRLRELDPLYHAGILDHWHCAMGWEAFREITTTPTYREYITGEDLPSDDPSFKAHVLATRSLDAFVGRRVHIVDEMGRECLFAPIEVLEVLISDHFNSKLGKD